MRNKIPIAIVVMFAFFSVMLTTSAPLQNNTILTSSSDFSSNSAFQYAYATSDGGGDEGGGNDEGNGDEGSEESGDEGSGDANDESEASDTNSSNSTGDPSSFFGDEGTPESASADASESTEGTTGTSPTEEDAYAFFGAENTGGDEGTSTPPEQTDGTGTTETASTTSGSTEGASSLPAGAQGIYSTSGGEGEDTLNAAKNKVAVLEAQLETAEHRFDNVPLGEDLKKFPASKQERDLLQAELIAAKQEVLKLETAKASTTNPATTAGVEGTTTPATTTGGGEDKVEAAKAAKLKVAQLEAQLLAASAIVTYNPSEVVRDVYKNEVIKLQTQLEEAKKDAAHKDAMAKSTTTTPATTGGVNTGTPPPTGGVGNQLPNKVQNKEVVKVINKNKVVVRDNNNDEKEIIIAGDKITCPTQTETVSLKGQINPKGIRLLADFDTCKISDGSMTLNIPNTDNIKLALLFIDKIGNNDAGVIVQPVKIQDLSTNQALFSLDLDGNMNGVNPKTGQSNNLTNINGLALFNDGNEPIKFNSGNIAALTATFTK